MTAMQKNFKSSFLFQTADSNKLPTFRIQTDKRLTHGLYEALITSVMKNVRNYPRH